MSENPISLDKPAAPPAESGPDGSGQGPRRGRARLVAIVVIALLAVFLAGRWHLANQRAAAEAREIVALVLDRAAGPGNWTIGEATRSQGVVEAKNVSVDLKHLEANLVNPLLIDSVKIETDLTKDELASLLALTDWRDQPGKALARRVALAGVSLSFPDRETDITVKAAELSFGDLKLSAAGPESPSGWAGFLRGADIGRLDVTGLAVEIKGSDKSLITLVVDRSESHELRLAPGGEAPLSLIGAYLELAIGRQTVSGVRLSHADADGVETLKASIAEQAVTEAKNLSYKTLTYQGVSIETSLSLDPEALGLEEEAGAPTRITASADRVDLADLDLRPMLDKLFAAVDLSASFEDIEAAMSRFTTLADIFTLQYSLGRFEGRGMGMTVDDSLKFSVEYADYQGPAAAGEIPPAQSWTMTGLRVELPTADTGSSLDGAYVFGRDFGQSVFTGSSSVTSTYEPGTGALTYKAAPLLDEDALGSVSGELGLVGLTPPLVQAMGGIPVVEAENVLFVPEFKDLGLGRLKIEITDRALVDKILQLYAERMFTDKDALRTSAAIGVAVRVGLTESRVENSADLARLASEFVLRPARLVVEATPTVPLSMTSILESKSQSELLNSLNAIVTVNDNPPLVIKFHEPPPAPGTEGQEPGLDNLDIQPLDDLEDLSRAPLTGPGESFPGPEARIRAE